MNGRRRGMNGRERERDVAGHKSAADNKSLCPGSFSSSSTDSSHIHSGYGRDASTEMLEIFFSRLKDSERVIKQQQHMTLSTERNSEAGHRQQQLRHISVKTRLEEDHRTSEGHAGPPWGGSVALGGAGLGRCAIIKTSLEWFHSLSHFWFCGFFWFSVCFVSFM